MQYFNEKVLVKVFVLMRITSTTILIVDENDLDKMK